MRAHDAIEFAIRLRGEEGKQIGNIGFESLIAALRYGFDAEIDTAGMHARIAHRFQEFAAPATDIQYVLAVRKKWPVKLHVPANLFLGAAKTFGKTAVIHCRR